ncbi:ATP-binding cassette domain-containing protein [Specibacter sp. AOP5-B1-6]|uniref:ATP-binding cassette domain-containing protein n=1 Tax=Specibacter sp. AOP5-B1-6 TaxID=3457653 RepID=UPI00402B2C68
MTAAGSTLEVTVGLRSWTLHPGQRVLIGRGADAQILVADPKVSRTHASVQFDGGWWIQDENSAGGLWSGGRRVPRLRIDAGTQVHLGNPDDGAPGLSLSPHLPEPGATLLPSAVDSSQLPVHTGRQLPQTRPLRPVPPTPQAPQAPQEFSLSVGRGVENDVVVRDVLASRNHATLHWSEGRLSIEDRGSLNGTFANGMRLQGRVPVSIGDRVTVGNSDFEITLAGGLINLKQVKDEEGLRLEGVGFTVRDGRRPKALLHDIEFEAGHGQLLAVIGPSGAGKSTLMGVLTGAKRPSAGSVRFDHQDIVNNYAALRTRIGFVPQDDILHKSLTIRAALEYAARLRLPADTSRAERREQVDRVLGQLDLHEQAGTKVSKLSGGQRKRASVAMELLTEPALLILDEPTSGLDPAMDKQVMDTLRLLANAGRVVVVVTHNVANLDVCDRVVLLAKGGLPAYLGAPEAILGYFQAPNWAGVFKQASEFPEQLYARFRENVPRLARRAGPATRPAEASGPVSAGPAAGGGPAATGGPSVGASSSGRQFRAVMARQLSLLWADKGYFAFLSLLPLVLGVLALVVPGTRGFGVPDQKDLGEPSQLLVVLVFGAAFMGMALSAKDLVTEREIFRREKAVGLRPAPYLFAKALVFTGICLVQSLVMTAIVLWGKPAPDNQLLPGLPGTEIFIAIALTACVCAFLGLGMSAWVRSADQVMPLLVVTAMAQLVLSGGLIPVTGRLGLEQISWLSPTRWGFALGAQSIDLKSLVPSSEDDWFWTHSFQQAGIAAAVLVILGVIYLAAAWIRLVKLPANTE